MDVICLGFVVLLWVLTAGLIRLCDLLGREKKGGR